MEEKRPIIIGHVDHGKEILTSAMEKERGIVMVDDMKPVFGIKNTNVYMPELPNISDRPNNRKGRRGCRFKN